MGFKDLTIESIKEAISSEETSLEFKLVLEGILHIEGRIDDIEDSLIKIEEKLGVIYEE